MDEYREELEIQIESLERNALSMHTIVTRNQRVINKMERLGHPVRPQLIEAVQGGIAKIGETCNQLAPLYELYNSLDPEESPYGSPWQVAMKAIQCGVAATELFRSAPEDDQKIFYVDENDPDGNRKRFSGLDLNQTYALSGWGHGLEEAINDTLTEQIVHRSA